MLQPLSEPSSVSQINRWLAGVDTVVSTTPPTVSKALSASGSPHPASTVGGVASADANTCSAYGALTDSTRSTPDDAAVSVTINPTPLLPPMY